MEKIKILIILVITFLFILANTPEFLKAPMTIKPSEINGSPDFNSWIMQPTVSSIIEPSLSNLSITWHEKAIVPADRYRTAGCCDTSGNFYVIGGWANSTASNVVFKYFTDSDSWCQVTNLPYAVTNHCAVYYVPTNRIYVFCGYDGSNTLNYTQIYDIARDSWYLGTPASQPMVGTYGAAIGDSIFITGVDSNGTNLGLWCYRASTNIWSYIEILPGGSASGGAASYGNKVYFSGGWPDKDTVAVYEIGVGASVFAQLPRGQHGHGTEIINGKLWIFGGGQAWGRATANVYSYDLDQGPGGNWITEDPMISTRYAGAYGKVLYQDTWRLHAATGLTGVSSRFNLHEQGTIPSPPPIDAKLLKINQPSRSPIPNSSVYPNVTVKNAGTNAISNIPVTIWIDSTGTRIYNQSQIYAGTLNSGDTAKIIFSTNFNIGGPGTSYGITAFTDLPGDSNRTNDTLSRLSYIPGLIWSELPSAPGTTYACAGCGDTSGHFYVLGGFVNDIRSDNNWLYDEINRTWTIKQNLLNPAANFYAAYDLARNRIFCLGGTSPDSLLQIYHVDGDTWSLGSPPPTTSVGPFAIICDTLYSFGSKLHRYHIPTNSWDSGISIPRPQSYCAICTYEREFYFSGGWSADPTVLKYTLETNTWTQLPDLPVGRHSHGMEVIDDKIVVFGGGQSWSTALNSVYVLDPHYPQAGWVAENSMVFGRIRGASAAVTCAGITRLHAACGYSGSANVNEHEAASYHITYIEEANSSYITMPLLKVIPTLSKHNVQIKVVTLSSGNGSIKVFDNCGRLIRKLSPILGKGEFTITWDKTDNKGISVSPGIYFIILEKRGETLSEKVVIID